MDQEEIKNLRKKLGLTTFEFATLVGLRGKHRDRTAFRWESGASIPSLATEAKILKLMENNDG
jgi:DNA-binding transcriptional regulator YiaG